MSFPSLITAATISQVSTMCQELDLIVLPILSATPQPPYKVANINFILKLMRLNNLFKSTPLASRQGSIMPKLKAIKARELLQLLHSLPTLRTSQDRERELGIFFDTCLFSHLKECP